MIKSGPQLIASALSRDGLPGLRRLSVPSVPFPPVRRRETRTGEPPPSAPPTRAAHWRPKIGGLGTAAGRKKRERRKEGGGGGGDKIAASRAVLRCPKKWQKAEEEEEEDSRVLSLSPLPSGYSTRMGRRLFLLLSSSMWLHTPASSPSFGGGGAGRKQKPGFSQALFSLPPFFFECFSWVLGSLSLSVSPDDGCI